MLDLLERDHLGSERHNCLSAEYRKQYYLGEVASVRPIVPAPEDHTMKAPNFLAYIGRDKVTAFEIKGKKFSPKQRETIAEAYRDLAPKFYPVLSSLQRFWVAVFGSVAAGCGAEPFRLRSTASRRGLIV